MLNSRGIIFAADIPQKDNLLKTIEQVNSFVEAIKIGNLVLYEHGWDIIREIKTHTDRPIIADLKLMDVPHIADRIVRRARSSEADGIVICGPAGPDVILLCKDIFHDRMLFVFTQFTHMTGLISDEMADEYVDLALFFKCSGIQVPATIPGRIMQVKQKVGNELCIVSCGIGAQGAVIGSAIRSGADYEIIGRAIYDPLTSNASAREAAMNAKEMVTEALRSKSPLLPVNRKEFEPDKRDNRLNRI